MNNKKQFDNENKKHHHCNCGDDCQCHNEHEECQCGDDCNCGNEHNHETHQCNCGHEHNHSEQDMQYLEIAQRIKAEFENYKKRMAESNEMSYDKGIMKAVEKMLPVIDSFNQAKVSITDQNILKGFELVFSQLLNAFVELGVQPIESVGHEFDPQYHNAVLTGVDESKKDNEILEEYQQGFMLKHKVIRHSTVKINKLS